MRQVVVYELLSLDGVAQDPDEYFPEWDDEMDASLGSTISTQDAVILGRRSYDEWAGYWPKSDIEPFTSFINAVDKHIATSSPLDKDWNNSTAIDGDVVAFVRQLREQSGGDIGVHASISVAQALLAARLVDELRLVITPGIAGKGRRLLDGLEAMRFETISATTTPTGHLLVHYRVVR